MSLYDHFKYTSHMKVNPDVRKMTKYPGHACQLELRAALGMRGVSVGPVLQELWADPDFSQLQSVI